MKKLVSWILTFAIMLSFVANLGIGAFAQAEEEALYTESFTGEDKLANIPERGKSNAQLGDTTVPEVKPTEVPMEGMKKSGQLQMPDDATPPPPSPEEKAPHGPVEKLELVVAQLAPGAAIPSKPAFYVVNPGLTASSNWGNPNGSAPTASYFSKYTYYYMTITVRSESGFVSGGGLTIYGDSGNFSSKLSEDQKELTVYLKMLCTYRTVDELGLSHLPHSIKAGTAIKPKITLEYGDVELQNVYWVDSSKRAVSKFSSGNVYYLAVTFKAKTGYEFDVDDMDLDTEWDVWYQTDQSDINVGTFYIRYSLKKVVTKLAIKTNGPKLGQLGGKLKVSSVSGGGSYSGLTVITWNNDDYMYTNEKFLKYDTYELWWYFDAKSGYEFSEDMTVTLNGKVTYDWEWNLNELEVHQVFNTYDPLTKVQLSCPTPYVGMPISSLRLSKPAGANYTITGQGVFDLETDELLTSGYIEEGKRYQLFYTLEAGYWYYFADNCKAYVNGTEQPFYLQDVGGYEAAGWRDFSFADNYVEIIDIDNVPYNIYSGQATVPALKVCEQDWDAQVSITNIQWQTRSGAAVSNFVEGQEYRLAVTLAPVSGRKFSTSVEIDCYGCDEVKIISSTKAVAYTYFSLLPSAGRVDVTVGQMRAGMQVKDLEVSISGNASLGEVYVYDEDYNILDENDVLMSNVIYEVYAEVIPAAGYQLDKVYCNGSVFYAAAYGSYDWMEVYARVSDFVDVDAISLTLPSIAVGKDVSTLKPTVPSNAKYDVDYLWYETSEATKYPQALYFGKLKKGHQYQLEVTITPKVGYVFEEEEVVYVNGVRYDGYSWDGTDITLTLDYSFMEKITRVDLPAMPSKIKKNQELSTNYTVDATKTYDLDAIWYYYNTDLDLYQKVTKATKNGIYELDYNVRPKAGYEFDENVQVYVGGKLVSTGLLNTTDWYVDYDKPYNLGMSKITKVELNTAQLVPGAAPGVTVPSSAKYDVLQTWWRQSDTNDVSSGMDESNLEYGRYTWVNLSLKPKAGYVFDEKVEYYFNGQKITPVSASNTQVGTDIAVYRGLLGITPPTKLPTPQVAVSGNGITWNPISYATSYEVYRSTKKSSGFTKVATLNAEAVGYTETSAAGKTYYYQVKAICASDPSLSSNMSASAKLDIKCAAPQISVVCGAAGKPVISWNSVTGAKKYTVYMATSASGKYKKLGTSTGTSYTDSKAAPGKVYYYKVIANASSSKYNSPYSAAVSCGVNCATPVVTVANSASGAPVVSWAKVTGAVKYQVKYCIADQPGNTVSIYTTATSSTLPTGAVGQRYTVQVVAVAANETYNSAPCQVVATVSCAAPSISGVVGDNKKPVIGWGAVDGAVTYVVYRSTKSGSGYVAIAEVGDLSFEDLSAKKGKTYYYKVVAVSAQGTESAMSNYAKVKSK